MTGHRESGSPVVGRRLAAVALLVAVAAGLGVRAVTDGTIAKVGGVVLYATAVYVVVLLVRPRTPATTAAVIATAACWAVEIAQLTPFPAEASRHSTLARLILGSTFHWPDLVSYPFGVLIGLVILKSVRGTTKPEPGIIDRCPDQ